MSKTFDVKVHRLAKYRRLDPLVWYYSDKGDIRLRRWSEGIGWVKANAVAVEDLPGGSEVVLDIKDGMAEVRLA